MFIEASATLRGLTTLERRILDVARMQLYEVVRVALRSAQETTLFRDRTGALRSKLGIVDTGAFEKRVVSRARHSIFIENGTRAHEIRPKNAKLLRFTVGGQTVFARKVQHPGTAKRPFMENAARAGGQAARILFDEGVAKAINLP